MNQTFQKDRSCVRPDGSGKPGAASIALACLSLLFCGGAGRAANFTTSVTQGVGQNWNGAIWTPDGGGTAVGPTAGNTYTVLQNGVNIFNLSANARVRNPTPAGLQTFPGDSLILTTNTEIRLKGGSAPIVNLPGASGGAGLIVDGGVLNIADNGVFTITGVVEVASTLLLNAVNDHGGATQPTRGLNLLAQLRGAGTFVSFNSNTNTPHRIANNSNTFSGKWLITSGWLLGAGLNSLGTNDITIDPLAPLGLDPVLGIQAGPALLDLGYNLNSAGALTLVNGGQMRLNRDCVFSAATIEGTPLEPGTHFFSDLAGRFPSSFLPGGTGSITIQPYGDPPVLAPRILAQPSSQSRFPGGTVHFKVTASGAPPLSYQWQIGTNGVYVNLADGGNVSGSTTPTLTLGNFTADYAADYVVVISNAAGTVTSAAATLSVAPPTGGAYEAAVLAANPIAYYQFNDMNEPLTNGSAFDHAGGFDGIYGSAVWNRTFFVEGPESAGFPGFAGSLGAVQFFNGQEASQVTVPGWNLNTNTVTITAWVNPGSLPGARTALVMSRGVGSVGGLYYSATPNGDGNFTLGYNWNDEAPTHGWLSGLVVPANIWSLVALVVSPSQATIYVINPNGALSATRVHTHVSLRFDGTTLIGNDPLNLFARGFPGIMDDVAIFNRSLSRTEMFALYGAASGVTNFPPTIQAPPASQTLYVGQTARFTVVADGNPAPAYQWQFGANGVYANVVDGGNISGATTSTLTISNTVEANAGDYLVIVTNLYGSVTSSIATLTLQPVGPPQHITLASFQPIGPDWNTAGYWSDGSPASLSAVSNPGSTYEVLPGGRLRSPNLALDSTFPGDLLTVSGDGVWVNNQFNTTIGEIRFKQGGPTGVVRFKKLVMNGGQLDADAPDQLIITGQIEILANTPIYNDTTGDRGCQIDAWLTGNGSIEYHAYNQTAFVPGFIYNLNITGTTNTYSGTWNVVLGVLLGTGTNSLGTNDITVGVEGALETAYDLNNPHGSLFLDGRAYLHQNWTFRNVVIGGTPLAAGTYSFAQLAAAFPTSFPASWTRQTGSAFSTGSGSLTILGASAPSVTLLIQPIGPNLHLTWPQGTLQEADDITGPWLTNSAASPYSVMPSAARKFYRVRVQ